MNNYRKTTYVSASQWLKTYRSAALASALLLLSGCVSNPFGSQNILEQITATPDSGAISVSDLLNNARKNPAGRSNQPLTLRFAGQQTELSERQAEQLNTLANSATNKPITINCGPSASRDDFVAMSQGMRRCLEVDKFFQARARDTKARMQPQLAVNQVVVFQ